jgi:hypothetical protein
LKLGLDPEPLIVHLTTGADFDAVLTYVVGGVVTSWPALTEVSLVFEDAQSTVWDATVSTSTATFAEDKADADAMPDGTGVKLRYVNGTTDRVWFVGRVLRHG